MSWAVRYLDKHQWRTVTNHAYLGYYKILKDIKVLWKKENYSGGQHNTMRKEHSLEEQTITVEARIVQLMTY